MKRRVRIAPSILAADFLRLGEEIQSVEAAGADVIHVDIMDGRFVPNLAGGIGLVRAARRATQLPVDVHLMISEPDRYVRAFADAGADVIGVHVEFGHGLQGLLSEIRSLGKKSCAVLNPHTSEDALKYLMRDIDQVLVMTVNPGFGGQKFIESVVPKIGAVRELIDRAGLSIDIKVDGGVDVETAGKLAAQGANVLVAGSAIFGKPDRKEAIARIREAAAG
jgi:ribulose-phosphate 3-epimerase